MTHSRASSGETRAALGRGVRCGTQHGLPHPTKKALAGLRQPN
ncbi:hypothetical protein BURMUCGD2M_5106 [Burkholderia multivorans CGD2M]|uniref:Uncharacterized protein n=1 Tax=Burkholderia multivorans CGD2 TaxID=513052 RepID=B9BJ57_9BURK|nr:hypothetical protein BURMUCGD2_5113 [Burkholderia multivorans CGD2]EEE15663.1 hypothetical protein BURMUCGD2M_5106 [Burkholderia multivorans CGD2M]